jgi:hypothetical protein
MAIVHSPERLNNLEVLPLDQYLLKIILNKFNSFNS